MNKILVSGILALVVVLGTVVGADEQTEKTKNHFDGGSVHIISSSHQDIAWMNSPHYCRNWRDVNNMTPSLELMKKDKDYHFTVETMMYLMDELDDHPERREEIYKLTKSGQLEWGATYTQPYESFLSGEQMIRGMYLGRKWLHKTFDGCDAKVAWNPDVPGRAMQFPQILSKAGIPYLMFSRHEKGFFNWKSPDGSGVTAYSPGHYSMGRHILGLGGDAAALKLKLHLAEEQKYFKKHHINPNFGLLNSDDFTKPLDFGAIMDSFGQQMPNTKIKYSSAVEFFDELVKGNPTFKTITGERPNVWLYIHGPGHQRAAAASRRAGIVLPAAEMFATVNCLLEGSFERYPGDEFFEAWKAACFPDHGWGGKKGDITDALFKEKLEYARDKSEQVLEGSLKSIASKIKTDTLKGQPIVVFNSLSWKRDGVVITEIDGVGKNIHITDAEGRVVPHQIIPTDAYGKSTVAFVGRNLPAAGYKTYYMAAGNKNAGSLAAANKDSWENKFYRITLTDGGIGNIYDKQLKKKILKSDKFLGGELFSMQSLGHGAGEFDDVQKPTMEGFDKVGNHQPKWELSVNETGKVRTVYKLSQKLEHCTVVQKLVLYNDLKKIDVETSLLEWDGTKNREFRLAFPVDMKDGKIAYEVGMGVLEVGKDEIEGAAGGRYKTVCKDVHPREVQNFITASNDEFGVTMSSCVAVCDWIDPTDNPVDYPILQPILLASRKSCHARGPWYLQEGDHHFKFSVLSHQSDWKNGYRFGIESNTPLETVVGPSKKDKAWLASEKSFFSVSKKNVLISTVKKCDDDDSVVVRLYDIEGVDSMVQFNSFFDFSTAEHTNIIEEDGKQIPGNGKTLETQMGHHAIETFKLVPREK